MDWTRLAEYHLATAEHLHGLNVSAYERAVCNRAYYAAYALVTSRLPKSVAFGRGWSNPEHAKVPAYVGQIAGLRDLERRTIKRAIRRLRLRREDADYRPGITVDAVTARQCMKDVAQVFFMLRRSR